MLRGVHKGPSVATPSQFSAAVLSLPGVNSPAASQLPFFKDVGGWVSENKLDCLDPTMLHYVKLFLLHRHR